MSAGKTISIRMPEGTVDELKAATGMPFGKLVRLIMLAYLERLRLERRTKEGKQLEHQVATDLREIVNKDADERGL